MLAYALSNNFNSKLKPGEHAVTELTRIEGWGRFGCAQKNRTGQPRGRPRIIANLNKRDGQVFVALHVLFRRIDNNFFNIGLVARLAVGDDENGLGATRSVRFDRVGLDRILEHLISQTRSVGSKNISLTGV